MVNSGSGMLNMILSVIFMRDLLVVLECEMGLAAIVAAIAVKTVKTLRIMTDVMEDECRRQYQGRIDGQMSSRCLIRGNRMEIYASIWSRKLALASLSPLRVAGRLRSTDAQ